jgi:serine/threonine protein phosphatase 1
MKPGIMLEDQSLHDLMWIRGEFSRSNHNFGKVVVYGHSPDKKNPTEYENRIAMDSGCFGSGVLSVVAFDDCGRNHRFKTISLENLNESIIKIEP